MSIPKSRIKSLLDLAKTDPDEDAVSAWAESAGVPGAPIRDLAASMLVDLFADGDVSAATRKQWWELGVLARAVSGDAPNRKDEAVDMVKMGVDGLVALGVLEGQSEQAAVTAPAPKRAPGTIIAEATDDPAPEASQAPPPLPDPPAGARSAAPRPALAQAPRAPARPDPTIPPGARASAPRMAEASRASTARALPQRHLTTYAVPAGQPSRAPEEVRPRSTRSTAPTADERASHAARRIQGALAGLVEFAESRPSDERDRLLGDIDRFNAWAQEIRDRTEMR